MRTLQLCALALALAFFGSGTALATDSGADYLPGPAGGAVPDATGDAFLTTLFAQDNNFAGNSFDITPDVDVTVVGWDVNLDTILPLWTVQIYTREGTANGHESNPDGWTMLGEIQVVGMGMNQPTHVDIGGLSISAGETVGVIITVVEAVTGTGGFFYTNGGPTVFSNDDMSVTTYRGLGSGWPPSGLFEYRQWNGTVHYNYGATPTHVTSWGSLKAGYQD
jgi:hypothetical protein